MPISSFPLSSFDSSCIPGLPEVDYIQPPIKLLLLVQFHVLPLHQYKKNCITVEPLYYGHQGDRDKCLHYRGVRFREVGFIWISVSQGPSELSVIVRCPY